jgi:raffinose/stachyose/melibiose transport system substrate-binding protein
MPPARIEAVSYDGKLYGQAIWNKSISFPIIYNKTLFKELGLEVPLTFEAFKDVCQKIKDSGVVPIYEYIADGWHQGLIVCHVGGRIEQLMPDVIEKLNTNQLKLKETPFLDALKQAKELVDLGYYGEDYISNIGNDTNEVLVNREYAMVVGMGNIEAIKRDYPDATDEFGMFLIPLLDNHTSQSDPYGPAKFASANTKYPDAIKAYFAFLMRPENLQYKLDNSADGWTTLDVTDAAGVTQNYSEAEKELMATLTDADYGVVFQNRVKYFNDQWMEYCKDLTSLFLGEMTAEQVCDSIDERRASMAKAQGDPAWQ